MASLSLAQQNEEMKKSMAPHENSCRIYKDEVNGGLYLDYSECRLKSFKLPQGVSPKDVTRLNLERTNIKDIPPIILQMLNLIELDLRHNRLKSVPPEISQLRNLQVLKLAVNSLTELPEAICEMESLEVLHLGANEITRLPKKFGNLRLKRLWINDNCFAHFPRKITNITTIEELYAQGNKIRIVPEEIIKLSNMTCFYIQKNKLTSLPRAIETLKKSKLTDFVFRSNNLKEFKHGPDQDITKIDGTAHHCKDTKRKSLGAKQKQTNVKRNKSASTTKAAKVKNDNVGDGKTTKEQTETSVTESSRLRVTDQAPENGQPIAAMCGEQLVPHTPVAAQDVAAKAFNIQNVFRGPTKVYLISVGNSNSQTTGVDNADFVKDKNTAETKDPVKDLIQHIADTACPTWKDIARRLGLTPDDIKKIQGENPGNMKECCIEALNLWTERWGKEATVEVLKKALIHADRQDVVDEFDAANCECELQDETTCDSGQVEEETCIKEAAGPGSSCSCNVASERRRHSPRDLPTSDQVQDPQAMTQPECTLPKQLIEEGNRRSRCEPPKETRAPSDNSRSLLSTCAACGQPTSTESQPRRRNRQGNGTRSSNRQANKRTAELKQDQTEGVRRHQSRPGPNSSAGHETGAPDRNKLRFPWNKSKPRL